MRSTIALPGSGVVGQVDLVERAVVARAVVAGKVIGSLTAVSLP